MACRGIEKALRPFGITPTEATLLECLLTQPGPSRDDLSGSLDFMSPVDEALADLEQRGFIRWRNDGAWLTQDGMRLATAWQNVISLAEDELLGILNSGERADLNRLLVALCDSR